MHPSSESFADLQGFSGTAPLFPLPSVALFPNVTQPLHVFEPRYRELTADALAGERLIALATLQPGWETTYESKAAPIHQVVCLGRITLDERLPDGRYLLLLRGLCRARIVSELSTPLLYRTAALQILEDAYPVQPTIDRDRRRRELIEIVRSLESDSARIAGLLDHLDSDLSLAALCDVLAFALQLPAAASMELLSATNVDQRSDLLLDQLRQLRRNRREQPTGGFPPPFSEN
jgi:Lon protease-like protein